ncbi:MAG: ATP-binding protein, partial [Nitrosarchaeum sp.]|nr:ATP-binding protein [Nitrosarchaeum sp.]
MRSGSKELPLPIHLDGRNIITHHVLIPATTGRGKSNLMKVLLWNLTSKDYAGILVLDPHDEYYDATPGLKDHPDHTNVLSYTQHPSAGQATLLFKTSQLTPSHFQGAVSWTQAQTDCLYAYHKHYGQDWIQQAILESPLPVQIHEQTVGVVKRRLLQILKLDLENKTITGRGPFSTTAGEHTLPDICAALEAGKTVIIDTSTYEGSLEILIGSLIAREILRRYKTHKANGTLREKPVIGIVLEEAPRVLGKEVLEQGPNIFSTLAREGRKFGIGLIAITQLPSLIPRQILANMNTKIILGTEMKPERAAIIESAAQDLSSDDRTIASLDKGEAILTSTFAPLHSPSNP